MRAKALAAVLALVTAGALALVAVTLGDGDDDPETAGAVGDDHDDSAPVDPEDRCDLGFNTVEFNETAEQVGHFDEHEEPHMGGHREVDYTIEEWAAVFAGEGVLFTPETLTDFINNNDTLRQAVTGGGLTETLRPDPWIPMTDPEECAAFADEVRRTREAIARYPTVADAEAAGYRGGSLPAPGQGAHYTKNEWVGIGEMNPDQPAQLMFDGNEPDSHLIGMAHLVSGDASAPPAGLAGDNDRWHHHVSLCLDEQQRAIGGDRTEEECAALGGELVEIPGGGLWMLHTWVVPGCESDWGLFSNANPRFPVVSPATPFESGCNSALPVTAPLQLADPTGGVALDA